MYSAPAYKWGQPGICCSPDDKNTEKGVISLKKLILATALAASTNATAATLEGDWYTRIGIIQTDPDVGAVENFLSETIETETGVGESVDFGNPRSYSLNIGYRINSYLAVEAGYTDLGDSSNTYRYFHDYGDLQTQGYEGRETMTYKSKVSGSTKTIGVVLSTNATRAFSVGVRAGVHLWGTKADIDSTYTDEYTYLDADNNVLEGDSRIDEVLLASDTDGEDAYYGVFANWRIGRWSYSLGHTLYKTDDVEPSVSSLALDYDF